MWRCPICEWETDFDPHKHYQFWPHDKDGAPFCYPCLIKALENLVPVMHKK